MKQSWLRLAAAGVWLAGGLASSPSAAEVEAGWSREEVVQRLGKPGGTLSAGRTEFLHYRRGMVELRGGYVVGSTVVSEAEYEQRREEARREAEARRERAEARRQELIRQGTAEKQRVLADGSVARRAPADQVAYWKRLAATYPGVDIAAELAEAERKLAEAERRRQELAAAEADQGPPPGLSSSKLRRYQRGRHAPAE